HFTMAFRGAAFRRNKEKPDEADPDPLSATVRFKAKLQSESKETLRSTKSVKSMGSSKSSALQRRSSRVPSEPESLPQGVELHLNEDGLPILKRIRPTIPEQIRRFCTPCLTLLAILDAFIFLFIIPFIIDPCISTIVEDYSVQPARCRTTEVNHRVGASQCSWASCRLGCTAPFTNCTQILVEYQLPQNSELLFENIAYDSHRVGSAALFINIKGCGYTPYTDCEEFERRYAVVDAIFPCHPSGSNSSKVILTYDPQGNLLMLILATSIPIVLFIIPMTLIFYWYCSCSPSTAEDHVSCSPSTAEDHVSEDEGETETLRGGLMKEGAMSPASSENHLRENSSLQMVVHDSGQVKVQRSSC
ncbi:unnamed protein product, partial [Cyprideis torosa]